MSRSETLAWSPVMSAAMEHLPWTPAGGVLDLARLRLHAARNARLDRRAAGG